MSKKKTFLIIIIITAIALPCEIIREFYFGYTEYADTRISNNKYVVTMSYRHSIFGNKREIRVDFGEHNSYATLMDDWGGAQRTSIYTDRDNNVVVIDPVENYLFKKDGSIKEDYRPKEKPELEYYGAFDIYYAKKGKLKNYKSFSFIEKEKQAECIPNIDGSKESSFLRPPSKTGYCNRYEGI